MRGVEPRRNQLIHWFHPEQTNYRFENTLSCLTFSKSKSFNNVGIEQEKNTKVLQNHQILRFLSGDKSWKMNESNWNHMSCCTYRGCVPWFGWFPSLFSVFNPHMAVLMFFTFITHFIPQYLKADFCRFLPENKKCNLFHFMDELRSMSASPLWQHNQHLRRCCHLLSINEFWVSWF